MCGKEAKAHEILQQVDLNLYVGLFNRRDSGRRLAGKPVTFEYGL